MSGQVLRNRFRQGAQKKLDEELESFGWYECKLGRDSNPASPESGVTPPWTSWTWAGRFRDPGIADAALFFTEGEVLGYRVGRGFLGVRGGSRLGLNQALGGLNPFISYTHCKY